jgi:hypothetical protein
VGLVLVDAIPEGVQAAMTPEQWKVYDRLLLVDPPKELAGYKELETIDFDVGFDQMRTAAKAMPLPPIPFIVISKGKREEPQLVIDAIRQMVEAARAETPRPQGGFLVRLPRIG